MALHIGGIKAHGEETRGKYKNILNTVEWQGLRKSFSPCNNSMRPELLSPSVNKEAELQG